MSEGGYLVPEEFVIDIKARKLMGQVPLYTMPSYNTYARLRYGWSLSRWLRPKRYRRHLRALETAWKRELIATVLGLDES